MAYCCVPLCTSKLRKKAVVTDVSFHEFPSHERRRDSWVAAIFKKGKEPVTLTDHTKVCSLHFKPNDYSVSTRRRTLLPHAVPSVVNHFPEEKKKRRRKKTSQKPSSDKRHKKLLDPKDLSSVNAAAQLQPHLSTEAQTDVLQVSDISNEITTVGGARSEITTEPTQILKRCDAETQTNSVEKSDVSTMCAVIVKHKQSIACRKKLHQQSCTISKLRKRNIRLHEQNQLLKTQIKSREREKENSLSHNLQKHLKKIQAEAKKGNMQACFLLEQFQCFGKKKTHFSQATIQISSSLFKESPKVYESLRKFNVLHLPHRNTLKYIHTSNLVNIMNSQLTSESGLFIGENEEVDMVIIDGLAKIPECEEFIFSCEQQMAAV